MKFIMKHGKSEKDIHNLRQEIEVKLNFFSIFLGICQVLFIFYSIFPYALVFRLLEMFQILRKLKHENIIEMLDSFESPQEFCVVTEFAQVIILFLHLLRIRTMLLCTIMQVYGAYYYDSNVFLVTFRWLRNY